MSLKSFASTQLKQRSVYGADFVQNRQVLSLDGNNKSGIIL